MRHDGRTPAYRGAVGPLRRGACPAVTSTSPSAHGRLVGPGGPNGAGKTTLIDAVGGFAPARVASCSAAEDVSVLAPHRRARLGLARTWQAADLFDDLTVRENLRVACSRTSLGRVAVRGVHGPRA